MPAIVPAEFSPRSYARIGGMLYLLIITAGLFAEFVRERFVVSGDAAATANNITDRAFMFRLGIAADLSTFVCAVALAIILYVLLKPVNRNAALLMLAFNLVQDAIGGLNALNAYRPLQLLGGAAYLKVFSREQLETMALLSLNTHSVGFAVAMIFFGCSCLALGYLTYYLWLTAQGPRRADGDGGRFLSHTQHRTTPLSPTGVDSVPVNPRAGVHR